MKLTQPRPQSHDTGDETLTTTSWDGHSAAADAHECDGEGARGSSLGGHPNSFAGVLDHLNKGPYTYDARKKKD